MILKKLPEYPDNSVLSFNSENRNPIQVFFQDKARLDIINIPVAYWVPKGIRSFVSKRVVREHVYSYAAINPNRFKHKR